MNNNKFTMELVWHNCLTYPPEEKYNENLYITDGDIIYKARYSEPYGWWNADLWCYVTEEELIKLWWADISQTFKNYRFN